MSELAFAQSVSERSRKSFGSQEVVRCIIAMPSGQ